MRSAQTERSYIYVSLYANAHVLRKQNNCQMPASLVVEESMEVPDSVSSRIMKY